MGRPTAPSCTHLPPLPAARGAKVVADSGFLGCIFGCIVGLAHAWRVREGGIEAGEHGHKVVVLKEYR